MRVAIVTTSYPAFPGDPSGHFVETEARRMAKTAEVLVVTAGPRGATGRPTTEDGGIAVWRLEGGEAFGWPGVAARVRERPLRLLDALLWTLRVRSLLATLPSVDRVVAHWAVPSAFPIASKQARRIRLEVVSHGADVRLLVRLPAGVRDTLVARLLEDASEWRFVSGSLRDSLVDALSPAVAQRLLEKSVVLAAAIQLPDVRAESHALRASAQPEGDGPLLVCVGRLVASKRFDRALDRAASYTGARVVVVGDGPERARLEALARAKRIDARFVGATSRDVAVAWIGAADALLHASRTEGLSTVVREAEALGVEVVTVA